MAKNSKLAAKLYSNILDEVLGKLAERFGFDVNEAKRLFLRKFLTITIGDVAENDQAMEKLGKEHDRGYNLEEIGRFRDKFEEMGAQPVWHCLNDGLIGTEYEGKAKEAVVLEVKGAVNAILESETGADDLEKELDKDEWMDKKVWSQKHGRVVNKNARWNNCFGLVGQEPDIVNKKGRVVAYNDAPLLKKIVDWFLMMEKEFGADDTVQLQAEGNYYYDEKCGIGSHGDAERNKANGIRLGKSAPLGYRWRIRHKGVGETMRFNFEHGTIYIMSEVAVGKHWKKSASLQLVHAAGAEKYMKQLEK